MKKKQSSIDWFAKKLAKQGLLITEDSEYIVAYLQAKAMHKEEVIDSYAFGDNDGYRYMTNEKQEFEHAEQYYNETFGGNNEH